MFVVGLVVGSAAVLYLRRTRPEVRPSWEAVDRLAAVAERWVTVAERDAQRRDSIPKTGIHRGTDPELRAATESRRQAVTEVVSHLRALYVGEGVQRSDEQLQEEAEALYDGIEYEP